MKKFALLLVVITLFACSSKKVVRESINTGNYLQAINTSIAKLADNKTKRGNQEHIYLLEEAFSKNTKRELNAISFLKKDGNPANLEKIYNIYLALRVIQERIKPLLPLRLYDEDRNAKFKFKDYTSDIFSTKNELSEYLYNSATNLLTNAQNKFDYRKAYDDYMYLEKINPNFKDTKTKIEQAYQKGLDYISVNIYNDSDKVIPKKLEDQLLDFNTYGLNNLWTRFHTNLQKDITYDYEIQVQFNAIDISPEQQLTELIKKEKRVKDGWQYVLDNNGNVKKDSLGNDIKEDKYIIAKCNFYKYIQQKDAQILGKVSYVDLTTKQTLNSYPLSSGFTFKNIYGEYNGDKRALDDNLLDLTKNRPVPFPSNEQMVYDSGNDLKNNIKNIIIKNGF